MALTPCVNAVQTKVLKTATANTTYASQLTELNSVYSTLTDEQKKRCILTSASGNSAQNYFWDTGVFGRYSYSGTNVTFNLFALSTSSFRTGTATSLADNSSQTYTSSLQLEIIDNI